MPERSIDHHHATSIHGVRSRRMTEHDKRNILVLSKASRRKPSIYLSKVYRDHHNKSRIIFNVSFDRRCNNNLRYADDTTLIAENNVLLKVKVESGKVRLFLNIKRPK